MFCGLDFGTSNSTLAAIGADGGPVLLPLESAQKTVPSAIFFDFSANDMLIGRAAQAAYMSGADGRLMRALKSILGSSLANEKTRIKTRLLPFIDIIGLFVAAAWHADESEATGLDGAMRTLKEGPAGPLLLALVALGFVAYGVYSFVRARYGRL